MVKVELTGRHIEITPAIRSFVQKRVARLGKAIKDDFEVHVILSVEKHRHRAEIILASKILHLTGVEQSSDMYNSINKAADKIDKQALKYKEKRFVSNRRATTAGSAAAKAAPAAAARTPRNRIIEKSISKKPMAIEDAIVTLRSSDDGFVVFRDSDSDLVNVVYKRKDGNIGLIRA